MSVEQTIAHLEEAVGEWWTASDPTTRTPGMLRRLPDAGMWEVVLFRGLVDDRDFDETLTLYGATSAGPVTLRSASRWEWGSIMGGSAGAPELFYRENWRAFSLIHGGHFEEDQLWQQLGLDLPYSWDWFSPVMLERNTGVDPLGKDYFEELSCTVDDQRIELWRSTRSTHGRRLRSVEGTGGYRIVSETGFTLTQADHPILALEALHQVLFGKQMTTDTKTLSPLGNDPYSSTVLLIDGHRSSTPALRLALPYFGTGEIDFEQFVPSWIRLHTEADTWPSVAPLGETAGWLQTQVIEAVNAAEALARHLGLESSEANSQEEAILKAIEHLPKNTRDYAAKAMEIKRDTLAERLRLLAQSLGPHSARWLFGDDVRQWAATSAEVRNALSHGYPTMRKLEKDPNTLFAVLSSVRVVQKLAMLRAAGFSNGQIENVELLADTTGESIIRHVNSSLAEEATSFMNEMANGRRGGKLALKARIRRSRIEVTSRERLARAGAPSPGRALGSG